MTDTNRILQPGYVPNYDQRPFVTVPDGANACVAGWPEIADRLRGLLAAHHGPRTVLVIDCYVGVDVAELCRELAMRLNPAQTIHSLDVFLPPESIERLVAPYLGGDDPIFGYLSGLTMPQLLDPDKLQACAAQVDRSTGLVLIAGPAASAIHAADVLIYADMPRWEGQLRQRRQEVSNLGVERSIPMAIGMEALRRLHGLTNGRRGTAFSEERFPCHQKNR